MPIPTIAIDFQITVAGWRRIPQLRKRLYKAAEVTIAHLPRKFHFPFSITILLTNDSELQQLNHDFRGINKATNVLSFPQFSPRQLTKIGQLKRVTFLGDIALAYPYVVAEARRDNKLLINHTIHLVIHGLLHLFGYDHRLDREALKMEKLETTIMASLDLPDPYTPLHPPRRRP